MTKNEAELNALSLLAQFPKRAFELARKVGVEPGWFTEGENRSAYMTLLNFGSDNGTKMMQAIRPQMPSIFDRPTSSGKNKALDAFVARVPTSAHAEDILSKLAESVIRPQGFAKIQQVYCDPNLPYYLIPDQITKINDETQAQINAIHRLFEDDPEDDGFDGTLPTPDELMDMPGFVNNLTAYTLSVAHRPNRVLAFAGALAMLSYLAGRKFTDKRGAMPNLYLVALANSGTGKDAPRKTNKRLAMSDKLQLDGVADQIGSGQGLEDALFESPAMLYQMDEFDTLLNSLKDARALNEQIYNTLLTFFSESSTSHAMRSKALTQVEKQALMANPTAAKQRRKLRINNPSLTLFATAIPDKFYTSLTSRALDNGLLARCLVFEAGKRGASGTGDEQQPFPNSVIDFAQHLVSGRYNQPWNEPATLTVVPDDEGVATCIAQIKAEADKLYAEAEKQHYSPGLAIWNRGFELTGKLGLLYAISENAIDPKITVKGLEWGWKLVKHCSQRMLKMADVYISTDRDDEDVNKLLLFVQDHGRKGVMKSHALRMLHFSAKRLDNAANTLKEREQIKITLGPRNSKIYTFIARKGSNK